MGWACKNNARLRRLKMGLEIGAALTITFIRNIFSSTNDILKGGRGNPVYSGTAFAKAINRVLRSAPQSSRISRMKTANT